MASQYWSLISPCLFDEDATREYKDNCSHQKKKISCPISMRVPTNLVSPEMTTSTSVLRN
ncbi:hypothetical protein SC09_contig4orf00854 [Bacillus subtilis]|uniref:Uncharacterized protein n=1 Tax=Bacillus subtilis TaxID=1423 RepID=A0A0D1KC09_BACIU|nr:hypothetical protein SC09_contig4orf00854 [Bacillus subtilis]